MLKTYGFQGPREGWAEGALAPPPFLVPLKKNNNDKVGKFISQCLVPRLTSTVEPRFNEVPRDWGNWFVILRVRYIEFLFHTLHY